MSSKFLIVKAFKERLIYENIKSLEFNLIFGIMSDIFI
jgi:hypothetical protein